MVNFTTWYAVKLIGSNVKENIDEVTEHLSMNGYTFDTNGEDTLFIDDEEIDYVITILNDRDIEWEAL